MRTSIAAVPQGVERRADVVILTAIRLEFDAVRQVDAGAVPGSMWEIASGPSGLPVAFRSFEVARGRPLRVAAAVAPDMGATAAITTLLPLIEAFAPRCIAMCGVCAGRRGKVELGDVVAADRLYYHDAGKQLADHVQQDLTTYKLRDDWKTALEAMDPVARFRDEPWFQARPLTTEDRLHCALVALRDGATEPWTDLDLGAAEWPRIVAALRERRWLTASGRALTRAGRAYVDQLVFEHRGALPDLSPVGGLRPFRLHVAPIGSGARVVEDEAIWSFVSLAMRKTLGIEMEAAAIGELAHRQRQHRVDAMVMKGVMDFADHGRDDHMKGFAARASAECLLWFLREQVATELVAGVDDLLAPGTLRLPDRAPAPSLLLDARYGVVPWREAGRSEILADLDAWVDDLAEPVAVRLLYAEGGAGKTRLAIEWLARRRRRHDVAGFLVQRPPEGWLERLCGLGPPVILAIDYAESRADLVAVLQRVAALSAPAGPRRRVRVLLLARNDGDWWEELRQRDPAIVALCDACAPSKLQPLATTPAEREAVFAESARAFAAQRRRLAVPHPPMPLDDVRFERALYLHMAALAAVEGLPGALDAGALMSAILAHEERFWLRETSDRAGAAIDVLLARRLVVAATLRGGLASYEDAHALCERIVGRRRDRADDELIALLHDVYDRGDRGCYLPGLEPDLLGEGMARRLAAPPPGAGHPADAAWIARVIVAGDDPDAITTAFTVLGRASATDPAAVRPWLDALLRRELNVRAALALRAAIAVGRRTALSVIGDALADALERRGSVGLAVELTEELPRASVSLQRVAEWAHRMWLEIAPTTKDKPSLGFRAQLLIDHAVRLRDLGEREPARAAARAAADLLRRVRGARVPHALQLDLARSFCNVGVVLSQLGLSEPALAVTLEAVQLLRRLAARDPGVFQPDLAHGLYNLGLRRLEHGEPTPALAAAQEAVELGRALVARDPDAFQPHLAIHLHTLGVAHSALGQDELALVATCEAVELRRALAARDPDAFQPELALSLISLGSQLHKLDQHEPALGAASEVAELYRALAARDPDAFQPELANSLRTLGLRWLTLDRSDVGLSATREAAAMYRALAARRPDVYQPDLATTLRDLSFELQAVGEHEPAIATARETIELHRALAAKDPDAFLPDLAVSVFHLGRILTALGRFEDELIAVRETVDVYRVLAARRPAFQNRLAENLDRLGDRLGYFGQTEPALAMSREAVELYRALVAREPAFQPELAKSVHNLGVRLDAFGDPEAALAATREAMNMWRQLAARDPVYQRELAMSLTNLGFMLQREGKPEPAIAAIHEAAELYRRLADQDPAYERHLERCLVSLNKLSSVASQRGSGKRRDRRRRR